MAQLCNTTQGSLAAGIARHEHAIGVCAVQPDLADRLVLGAVMETLRRFQRRKFQYDKAVKRKIAFDVSQVAAADEIPPAHLGDQRRATF
jgi:hypothetical protein